MVTTEFPVYATRAERASTPAPDVVASIVSLKQRIAEDGDAVRPER